MPKSLLVRFADRVSATQTTADRIKTIADHFGVSQNKAAHIAINRLFDEIASDVDAEAEFEKHGRKVGGVTYLHTPEDFLRRVEERIAKDIPLPHEDDESLESNLLFRFLSEEQQDRVKAASDPLQKRHLIAEFAKSNREPRLPRG